MAILRIARMGHPVLRQVAQPVPPERIADPSIQALIDDMLLTLGDYEGAGLAAPQVHMPLRVVVLVLAPESEPVVLINPEITFLAQNMLRSYEGCLSVPDLRGAVNRVGHVRVDALDRAGQPLSLELEGFGAIAVQHECDHLDGVLYVDRCDLRTLTYLDELRRFGPLDPSFRKPEPEPEPEPEPGPGDGGGTEPIDDGGAPEPTHQSRGGGRGISATTVPDLSVETLVMAGGPQAEG